MGNILIIVLVIYLIEVAFGYWLDYLNLIHLEKFGAVIPPAFEGQIDQALLRRTRDYTVENTKFGFISSAFSTLLILGFFFGGLLNVYNAWIVSLDLPFILSGIMFFLVLTCASTVLSIPFSLYRSFRIEKKYGFNTMTMKIWLADFLKSVILSAILTGLLVIAGLWLIQKSPHLWWLWVWVLFFAFSIFLMYIAPYVIEPLFNKFEPLQDESLNEEIGKLVQKVGVKVSRVFKMDASKRTKHTNAYFTGIGKVKRVVLYDTLLGKMDRNEILAVLAHELGHWKKKHLLKHLIAVETISLVALYLSYRLLQGDFLTTLFHLKGASFFTKIVVLAFLGSLISFPFEPLFNLFSRKHEREADRFSYELTGDAGSMINTLVKLSKDNLSNLHPHPLYAAFHYSHPPVLERIGQIKEGAEGR
jgi:STE24 endopeptidase